MREIGNQWGQVAILTASVTAASCSVFGGDAESQWRQATVISVQPRAELSKGVDVSCVGPDAVAPNDEVAVVKYRVGRAPHQKAFAIIGVRSLHTGDTVVVNPGQCTMRDKARAS